MKNAFPQPSTEPLLGYFSKSFQLNEEERELIRAIFRSRLYADEGFTPRKLPKSLTTYVCFRQMKEKGREQLPAKIAFLFDLTKDKRMKKLLKDRQSVVNMGRNFSIKLNIPLSYDTK